MKKDQHDTPSNKGVEEKIPGGESPKDWIQAECCLTLATLNVPTGKLNRLADGLTLGPVDWNPDGVYLEANDSAIALGSLRIEEDQLVFTITGMGRNKQEEES